MYKLLPLLLCLFSTSLVLGQPVADFTASEYRGCTPLVIDFTNLSKKSTKFEWDLGNGNKSTLVNPSAIYYKPGKYEIKLKAFDSSGQWSEKSTIIQVLKDPKANFSLSSKTACVGEIVDFIEKAEEGDTTINLWSWDFGDGNLDTGKNVSNIFKQSGKFSISLYVKDANGCTHDTVIKQTLDIWPLPIADFVMDERMYCAVPAKVEFINESWIGEPHTYEWDFGDGSSGSTAKDPAHSYQKLGSYSPRLIVTSVDGCKDTFTSDLKIEIYPLQTDFTSPALICGPDNIPVLNKTFPSPSSTRYEWFIDGVKSSGKKDPSLYLTPGKHTIKLVASDSGCYDEISKTVMVKATPTGKLTVDPDIICAAPQTVTLKFTPDTFDTYQWYIDGQRVSNDTEYQFTAKQKKDYNIKLVITDDNCVNQYIDTVLASTPDFTISTDTSGCIPLPVSFKLKDNSKNGIKSFKWLFGDGDSSSSQNPYHVFQDTGVFNVRVLVTDSFGCEGTKTVKIRAGTRIKPNFNFELETVCNGDTITFFNLTNEDPVKPHLYIWLIGDSMSITPTKKKLRYVFHQKPNNKEVILQTDHFGCRDSLLSDTTIRLLGPFSWPVIEGPDCAPSMYKFIDKSVDATESTWLLDPVDGETDKEIDKWLEPGKYRVGLATYNRATRCRDTSYVMRDLRLKPELKLELMANAECPPVTSNIRVITKNAFDVIFVANNQVHEILAEDGEPIDVVFHDLPSRFKVYAKARKQNQCFADTTIIVDGKGPSASANVKMTGNCFPYTLSLEDYTYGRDKFEHYWHIGNLTPIKVTAQNMTYTLRDKPAGMDTVTVELVVTSDSCYHSKKFFFPVDTRDAELSHSFTEFCNDIEHRLSFKHKQLVGSNVYQTWGVNDQWNNNPSTDLAHTYNIEKDGLSDTLKLRVHYSKECVTQFSYVTPDSGKGINAAFTYDTSGSPCPPLFVNFTDQSTGVNQIVSWEWDLGDGSRSMKKNPGKIYFEPGSYGVSLAIADNKGCADTTYLPDIIVVEGPTAELIIEPLIGCVPLLVNFTGISNDTVTYSWDLGDGYVEEGQTLSHLYTLPGNYTPLLTIEDNNDCKYTLPPDKVIQVKPYPRADFTVTDQCAGVPTDLQFTGDSSGSLARIEWDFGNGTSSAGETEATHTYMNGGVYDVMVTVENEGGCVDSTVKKVKIYDAYPAFEQSEPGVCIDEPITLTDLSTADTTIISRKWLVNGLIVGTGKSIQYATPFPGIYPVGVQIETAMGCTYVNIDTTGVIVTDTLALQPALIRRVSVLDDFTVELVIDENPDLMLAEHSVWMQDPVGGLNKVTVFNDDQTYTSLSGLNTLDSVYCMMVKRESHCETPFPDTPAHFHCTVEVTAQGVGPNNFLDWTPYIGWDTVGFYEIYSRLESEPVYSYLATVPGDQLTYIDSSRLCKDERRYHIKALQQGGFEEYSWSDTAHAIPENGHPVFGPEVWRASVENDEYVILEWIVPKKPKVPLSTFEIFRESPSDPSESQIRDGWEEMNLIDENVFVDDKSYLYKVRATDTCGNISVWSNVGKTVLLKVGFDSEIFSPTLSWSKYREWNEGVEKYLIERLNEQGGFDVIAQSDGPDDTTYIDPQAYQACTPTYCYRVTAIRNQPDNFPDSTHDVISHSNVQCAPVESHLYAPTAFTMNRDGLNETFQPVGMFMETYELRIFNRWGEILFETTECFGDWDGTYQGEPCQVDVYVFEVKGFGADGKFHQRIGTVHLLK